MDIPNTHLFTAYYDDGTAYVQGFDDKSIQDEDRNALYDVLFKPIKPIESLIAFQITVMATAMIPDNAPQSIAVDLRTGLFSVDGVVFSLHNSLGALDDATPREFRLIFYRNPSVSQTRQNGNVVGQHYSLGYVLGWQSTIVKNGKKRNIQKFISTFGLNVQM